VPGVSKPQLHHQTASCPKSSSSISCSASDKEEAGESGPGEQTQQPVTLQWTRPSCPQSNVAHTYTGGPKGKDNEALHIKDGSSPLSIFLLYFAEIITKLVVETNSYYHDYWVLISPLPDQEGNKLGSTSGTCTISTTSRCELSSCFFPAWQSIEGNSHHCDRNISLFPSWSG